MDIVQIIEIVALVMGIPYMILEVLQKNTMWYFGLFTSTACAIQFFLESNWAKTSIMSVWPSGAFTSGGKTAQKFRLMSILGACLQKWPS